MTPIEFRESDPRDVVTRRAAADAARTLEGHHVPPYTGPFPEIYVRDFARKLAFLSDANELADLGWARDHQLTGRLHRTSAPIHDRAGG